MVLKHSQWKLKKKNYKETWKIKFGQQASWLIRSIRYVIFFKDTHTHKTVQTQQTNITSKSACSFIQLGPTLCDPMDCSPPGSSVHGILQARTLEWVAFPFSHGSSRPRDRTPAEPYKTQLYLQPLLSNFTSLLYQLALSSQQMIPFYTKPPS